MAERPPCRDCKRASAAGPNGWCSPCAKVHKDKYLDKVKVADQLPLCSRCHEVPRSTPSGSYCDPCNIAYRAQRRSAAGYTGNSRPPAHSFYICADRDREVIKFGITNNTQRRLATHARGSAERPFELTDVVAVREYLGEGEPKDWEDAVKAVLREMGATPVIGSEYFDIQWKEDIIQIARSLGCWVPGFELAA